MRTLNVKRLILSGLAVTTVGTYIGCGHQDNNKGQPQPESSSHSLEGSEYRKFGASIEIKDSKTLSSTEAELLAKITAKAPISFSEITDLMIRSLSEKNDEQVNREIDSLVEALKVRSETVNIFAFKEAYESVLESRLSKKLIVNRGARDLEDLVLKGKIEAHTGTSLFQILARRHFGPLEFRKFNSIVIFDGDHVLPGQLVLGQSGHWHLYGIETLTSGPSIKYFGRAENVAPSIRFIDAEDFAILEIFKNNIKNLSQVIEDLSQNEADRYKIDIQPAQGIVKRTQPIVSNAGEFARERLESKSKVPQKPFISPSEIMEEAEFEAKVKRLTKDYFSKSEMPKGEAAVTDIWPGNGNELPERQHTLQPLFYWLTPDNELVECSNASTLYVRLSRLITKLHGETYLTLKEEGIRMYTVSQEAIEAEINAFRKENPSFKTDTGPKGARFAVVLRLVKREIVQNKKPANKG